jgi:cytochrome c-type protein NapC
VSGKDANVLLRTIAADFRRVPLRVGLPISFVLGIIFWGGFNTVLELTNLETFCISCHEMRQYVFEEFKGTVHYNNGSGVRASCPDCHVPKTWGYMVLRKIGATNELFHHLLGSVNTPEKFEAKKLELAEVVWRTMERTDSRECRNCHAEDFMDLGQQREVASDQHLMARNEGKTCIDCHKGIAHKLPKEFLQQEHARFERDAVPCWTCHHDMPRPAADDGWD